MLISHLSRFIYLKTIKTAGTSVEIYFEPYCVDPKLGAGGDIRAAQVSEWGIVGSRGFEDATWYNHMPAARVRELVGEEVWSGYFKFCVVRNPFDKVISQFWYYLSPPLREELRSADFGLVRETFLRWTEDLLFPMDRRIYTIDGAPAVDFFIRYERLHQDMEAVCSRLAIPWQPARVERFKSGFRVRPEPFAEYYSAESAARVRRKYAWELEYFQYRLAG